MQYTFYLPDSKNFKLFIDCDPDQKAPGKYIFNENRIVPVFIYLGKFIKAYIIKTSPGSCLLLNLDKPVTELVSATGSKALELIKFSNILRKNKISLDQRPDKLFVILSLALTAPRLTTYKLLRIFGQYKNG